MASQALQIATKLNLPASAAAGIALGVGIIAFVGRDAGRAASADAVDPTGGNSASISSGQEEVAEAEETDGEVPVEVVERMIAALRRKLPAEAMDGTTDEEIRNEVMASIGSKNSEGKNDSHGDDFSGVSSSDLDEINIAQILGMLLFILVCIAALFLVNSLSKGALMQMLRGLFPKELKLLGLM